MLISSFGGQPVRREGYEIVASVGQTEVVVSPGRFNGGPPRLEQSVKLTRIAADRARQV